nr:hypothetical protein [Tanacetum cinerariifolium]
MSVDVARSHGNNGRGKDKRKPNLGGRAAGRLNTRYKTRNISLKEITDTKGPVPIQFELRMWLIGLATSGRPHMESLDWTEISVGIQQHLQKVYNTNKAAFKAQHWVIDPTIGTYNGSRSLARLRDEMRQTSTTQEYPSLIDTFFVAHSVNEEFLQDEDQRIYEEMRRLEAMDIYIDDEINRLARG